MSLSWKMGTAFGIGIYVHASFLLLPAWVLVTSWGKVGPSMIASMLLLLIAIFGCVVLHELGHALMARYFDIGTRDITLYPIGGVARLERMSERPHEEVLIALAGPAVNVIIAAVLLLVAGVTGTVFSWTALARSVPGGFLLTLLAANVMLVVFNLVPAFPMDGGRVLRALLTGPFGRLRATEVAAYLGIVLAVIGVAVALFVWQNPMLMVVAGFVVFAGQMELAAVRRRETLRRQEPLEVIAETGPAALPAGVPADFTGVVWDARCRVWVLWHDGRPVARYGRHSE